jgi:hypothetical protein
VDDGWQRNYEQHVPRILLFAYIVMLSKASGAKTTRDHARQASMTSAPTLASSCSGPQMIPYTDTVLSSNTVNSG